MQTSKYVLLFRNFGMKLVLKSIVFLYQHLTNVSKHLTINTTQRFQLFAKLSCRILTKLFPILTTQLISSANEMQL